MKKILVLLGPNLNMIGVREKGIYGTETAGSIDAQIRDYADKAGCACEIFQSNWEGALVDKIHEAKDVFRWGGHQCGSADPLQLCPEGMRFPACGFPL